MIFLSIRVVHSIKPIRQSRGWNLDRFAAQSGIDRSTLGHIEKSDAIPLLDHAQNTKEIHHMKKLVSLLLSILLASSLLPLQGVLAQSAKPVKKINLSEKQVQLVLGAGEDASQSALTATISPSDAACQTLSWKSSDESIVTVNSNGVLRAVSIGKAKITATPLDGSSKASASCSVIVGKAVESVVLNESSVTLDKGKKTRLKGATLPEDALNGKLLWTSSDESVAMVDAKGNVAAKGTGSATITCSTSDGSNLSASCEITVVQKVTKITPTLKKYIAFQNTSPSMSVMVFPIDATNRQVIWSSSDLSVASIDSNGVITTGRWPGTTTITAEAADGSGKKGSFKLIVEPCVPVSVESMSRGVYLPNLLGLQLESTCKSLTVTNIDFEMAMYTYGGDLIDYGQYSLGKNVKIGPGKSKTIKRTMMGAGYASKIVITITGVDFADGTYYTIPEDERIVSTFRW